MKKTILLLLALIILLVSNVAYAYDYVYVQGDTMKFIFDDTKKELVVSGTGVVGSYAFNSSGLKINQNSINSLVFSQGIQAIYDRGFIGSENLKNISFPSSLKIIGVDAFSRCQALEALVLPTKLERIEGHAFANCNSLLEVNIPGNVNYIGNMAFAPCEKLKEIKVSENNNNYTDVGGVLFDKKTNEIVFCSSLYCANLAIPKSTKRINIIAQSDELFNPFQYCKKLTDITVHKDNKYFSDISGVLYNKSKTTLIYYPIAHGSSEKYTVPNGVTQIGSLAFSGNAKIKKLTLPNGLTNIGMGAFRDGVTITCRCNNKFVIKYCKENNIKCNLYGHKYSKKWTIDKKPTYFNKGSKSHHCLYCKKRVDETAVKKRILTVRLSQTGNSVLVKYEKVKQASKYQIIVIQNKKQKNFLVTKNNYKIKNLTVGKTYKIKVRAIKYINKKAVFSNFSRVKKIRIN